MKKCLTDLPKVLFDYKDNSICETGIWELLYKGDLINLNQRVGVTLECKGERLSSLTDV